MHLKLLKLERQNCNPCKLVSNFLESKGVSYVRVDVEENPQVASKYGAMSVPITLIIDDEGNVIDKSVGYKPNELDKLISKLGGL